MEIIGNFKNGKIIISGLKTEEGDYKTHFNFDLCVSTFNFSYKYQFGETAFFNLFDLLAGKQSKLFDENSVDNYLELTNEYFALKINQEGIRSIVELEFDKEDKESLLDFKIELKAWCESLMEK